MLEGIVIGWRCCVFGLRLALAFTFSWLAEALCVDLVG